MSYTGIGTTGPNHPLEVEGQVFISNVEQGSATNLVPFEVYSDYTGITISDILEGARQFRLRATPSTTPLSNVNVDMGIESTGGDYFYISNPVVDTPLGSNAAFRITQAGDVTIGDDLSVTGTISTSNTMSITDVLYIDQTKINIYSNVGIGITTPRTYLDVGGDALITGTLTASNIVGGSPLTLSSDSLVKIEGPGGLSATGPVTSPSVVGGTVSSSNTPIGGVIYVIPGPTYTVSQLFGGGFNSAIIDPEGRLFMKGNNSAGQLGLGYEGSTITDFTRTALNITDSITHVACGGAHTMIIAGGKVYGTGYNGYGQLGIGSGTLSVNTFTANATPVTNVSNIACGPGYTMIIDTNGTVSGTGDNYYGQLGLGSGTLSVDSFTANATPVTNATQIVCGYYAHTMIVANGTLSGTGYNYFGELGIGSEGPFANKDTFTANATPVTNVSKVACGQIYTMIVANGTVSGTGNNLNGQLGIDSRSNRRNTFTANATPVTNASEIACGYDHTMIIDTNGTVSGTGYNNYGQLGIGSGTPYVVAFTANATPVTNATQIACENSDTNIVKDNVIYTTNPVQGIFEPETTEPSVGIGVTNPGYQLELSQNSAAKPTSSEWTILSDRRIKEDIVDADLDTCLENVKNLKLHYFKLRDDIVKLDPMFNDSHKLGWIAQEVEEVLPKCVTTVPEQYGLLGVKNLDVDQIYVNMFGAIQKLVKENEELQVRIESLENK